MTVAGARRVEGKGKADIGGRLRVATILRNVGIKGSNPERVAGATNEVWRSGDYVIRVGRVEGANRLRREARLADLLPPELGYPEVIASGLEDFGEWLVVRNKHGAPMSEVWQSVDRPQRRRLTHQLASAMKAMHETQIDDDIIDALPFDERSKDWLPHQLPVGRILELLEQTKGFAYLDVGLIDAVSQRVREVADAFDDAQEVGLVHGDLHLENVLVDGGSVSTLLDFEWARVGPRELDLDVLARFCSSPELSIGGDYFIDRDAYRPVLGWINEIYPELFDVARLRDKLLLCAFAFEVPWLLRMPPSAPAAQLSRYEPVNRLRALIEEGTEAHRLGWAITGI